MHLPISIFKSRYADIKPILEKEKEVSSCITPIEKLINCVGRARLLLTTFMERKFKNTQVSFQTVFQQDPRPFVNGTHLLRTTYHFIYSLFPFFIIGKSFVLCGQYRYQQNYLILTVTYYSTNHQLLFSIISRSRVAVCTNYNLKNFIVQRTEID